MQDPTYDSDLRLIADYLKEILINHCQIESDSSGEIFLDDGSFGNFSVSKNVDEKKGVSHFWPDNIYHRHYSSDIVLHSVAFKEMVQKILQGSTARKSFRIFMLGTDPVDISAN